MRTLSFGLVDRRAVFMDERADSYFMLSPADDERLHRLVEQGAPLSADTELLEMLGVENEQVEVVRACPTPPSRSLVDAPRQRRPSLVEIFTAGKLVRSTRQRLRTRPIEAVLQDELANRFPSRISELRRDETLARAANFLSARRLVPFERNCLVDSLSLLRWLGSHRSTVALVFGAKLDPFAAHCWLQADSLLLNDRVESVAAFTPVRVIRCSEVTP